MGLILHIVQNPGGIPAAIAGGRARGPTGHPGGPGGHGTGQAHAAREWVPDSLVSLLNSLTQSHCTLLSLFNSLSHFFALSCLFLTLIHSPLHSFVSI